jgi:hypothetical protein
MPRLLVKQWECAEIDGECSGTYGAFRRELTEHYKRYFADHPDLADPDHPYKAKDFGSALPDSSPPEFGDWLPPGDRHPQHLSGNSSQLLALALLGTSVRRDRSLSWWWDALGALGAPSSLTPTYAFESKAAKSLLRETGGATSIDFFAEDDRAVICCECKWVESGFRCTCRVAKELPGDCRPGIYGCQKYWDTAKELFQLEKHTDPSEPCQLRCVYQAVRNVAAALALAGTERAGVFVLVYNADNPYFVGHGDWPGWATVLAHTLTDIRPQLHFRAVSWQRLIGQLPIDPVTRAWAAEKHGLA